MIEKLLKEELAVADVGDGVRAIVDEEDFQVSHVDVADDDGAVPAVIEERLAFDVLACNGQTFKKSRLMFSKQNAPSS